MFVCSLDGKTFYYGKVIFDTSRYKKDLYELDDCKIVVIFNENTTQKNTDDFKGDWNNLLVEPCMVSIIMWTRGYFESVGNAQLTEQEINVDLAYQDTPILNLQKSYFVDENDNYLDYVPKYIISGLTTPYGVISEFVESLILLNAIDYENDDYSTLSAQKEKITSPNYPVTITK